MKPSAGAAFKDQFCKHKRHQQTQYFFKQAKKINKGIVMRQQNRAQRARLRAKVMEKSNADIQKHMIRTVIASAVVMGLTVAAGFIGKHADGHDSPKASFSSHSHEFSLISSAQAKGHPSPAAGAQIAFANGFEACPQYFPGKLPSISGGKGLVPLCYSDFAVLYNTASKTPLYCVEKLNAASLQDASDEERTNEFYEERRLEAPRSKLSDYAKSGFDRGHCAPAADRISPQAMVDSFSLANMFPQTPVHNRKLWSKIESDTRKYAMRSGSDVYVYTGGVFSNPSGTIGQGRVHVPTAMYKLVVDPKNGKAWAHYLENRDDAKIAPPISKADLEKRIGITF
jgi:endonuclease G, mitochondrial